MVIKVNDKAIFIDVSMDPDLAETLKTTHLIIPREQINSMRLHTYPAPVGEVVQIVLTNANEIDIQYSRVTNVNGPQSYNSSIEIFNDINLALFGL